MIQRMTESFNWYCEECGAGWTMIVYRPSQDPWMSEDGWMPTQCPFCDGCVKKPYSYDWAGKEVYYTKRSTV